MNLTEKEIKILNGMRENEYNDALANVGGEYDFENHCGTWTFTAIENSGLDAKIARGVISSLIKKGLVIANTVTSNQRTRYNDEDTIEFTKAGAELFRNADGENCSWGGPKLLKEKEIEIQTETEEIILPKYEELTALYKIPGQKEYKLMKSTDYKNKSEFLKECIANGFKSITILNKKDLLVREYSQFHLYSAYKKAGFHDLDEKLAELD